MNRTRPKPLPLECHCDGKPVPHSHDWLVTFAHKVAVERNYSAHHPGHVFLVMLRRDEAEGLLEQVSELVAAQAEIAR